MASSYSTSLKLELIGNGDQSGTWGNTTNNNLGTLLEQAITGVRSITMLNADYVLTSFNGTSDESRNAVLVVSGTNSAIRQVVTPLVNKLYVVTNNTSGGFAITIGGVSGAAVTIPNGVTAQVYCDGTNFYSAQTGSAGNFNVNGTLTATGLTDTGNMSIGGTLGVTGATSLTTGAISGVMTAPTAAAGTNTTQLATTAFVTTAVSNAFPSGTRLPFAQATAPTGWTQDTSDNATNRMLRVVNTAGNGVGGSASPILMDVVPTHSHTASSGTQSADHSHSGTTGGMNASNPHTHGYPGRLNGGGGNPGGDLNGLDNYGYRTYAEDINHGHDFSTGGVSANHTHAITVNNNSGSNWTPRYIDLIICAKN